MQFPYYRSSLFLLMIMLFSAPLGAQEHHHKHELHDHDVYELDKKRETILLATGLTLSLTGGYLLHKVDKADYQEILKLDKQTLWGIDRKATNKFSSTGELTSDILLYSSFALPFWVYLSDAAKGEKVDCLIMTLETLLITSGITNIAKGLSKRYRPYNYNPIVPEELKLSHGSRLSFFSGHVSNTTAFCFLTAQALNHMHPHWTTKKYLTWTGAVVLPLAIGYGRYQAGKHFPTDILTGYAFGATVGLLIPRLHRSEKVTIGLGVTGVTARLNLNN